MCLQPVCMQGRRVALTTGGLSKTRSCPHGPCQALASLGLWPQGCRLSVTELHDGLWFSNGDPNSHGRFDHITGGGTRPRGKLRRRERPREHRGVAPPRNSHRRREAAPGARTVTVSGDERTRGPHDTFPGSERDAGRGSRRASDPRLLSRVRGSAGGGLGGVALGQRPESFGCRCQLLGQNPLEQASFTDSLPGLQRVLLVRLIPPWIGRHLLGCDACLRIQGTGGAPGVRVAR